MMVVTDIIFVMLSVIFLLHDEKSGRMKGEGLFRIMKVLLIPDVTSFGFGICLQ